MPGDTLFADFECFQALKMPYFSNKPGPSVGSDLPMPRSVKEVVDEIKQEHKAKRRKLDPDSSDGKK